jgi:adenylate cyclase
MNATPEVQTSSDEDLWREFLTTGESKLEKRGRRVLARLPDDPRCKTCNAPFEGIGAPIVRLLLGKRRSKTDPRFCNTCTDFMRTHPGGYEVEITMVFADVRGSTTIAEDLPPAEFSRLINRFYRVTTDVMLKSDAFIDRLIGDEVVGIFVPGLAGPEHARRAIDAAQDLMRATGHADLSGPWISVGAGVHTGLSYVGTVGSEMGAMDFTALGDVPNVAAHLASLAAPGEVIVSEAAIAAVGMDMQAAEHRQLQIKGRREEIAVTVLRVAP